MRTATYTRSWQIAELPNALGGTVIPPHSILLSPLTCWQPSRPRAACQRPPPNPAQAMKSSPLGRWEAWLPLTPNCHSHPTWSCECAGTKYKSRPQQPVSGSSGCTKNKVCRTGWLRVDGIPWSLKVPSRVNDFTALLFPSVPTKTNACPGETHDPGWFVFYKKTIPGGTGGETPPSQALETRDRQP